MKPGDNRPDREWLVRYVLGELSEEETRGADERFFSDDTFALILDETYRDVLDAYVAGEITGNERDRTEKAFFGGPYQGHQLKILQAMRSLPDKVTAAAPRTKRPWLLSVKPAAVFAALLGLAIVIVWHRTSEKNGQLAERNTPAEAPIPSQTPETSQAPSRDQTAKNVYTILLLPDVNRGNEASKSWSVPLSVDEIVFQIVLPGNQAGDTFDVRLDRVKDRARVFSGLKTQTMDGQKFLEFRVASADFPADDYAVDVSESSTPKKPAEHFVVHVTRPASHQN
jgi:hypothetical protein